MNEVIKDETTHMKKRINDNKSKFEKEKNGTKDLIQKVKDYLTGKALHLLVTPNIYLCRHTVFSSPYSVLKRG